MTVISNGEVASYKHVEAWRTQNLIDYVLSDLDKRVKRDKPTKLSVFFTGLSAYTREPVNLFLKGESGVGKSYNVVQTLQYFPKEDIWFLGGLSPKALIHQHGVLVDKYGEPISIEDKPIKPKRKDFESEEAYREAIKEYREKCKAYADMIRESHTLINLQNKIIVFLETPDYETFKMLYPILSHDTEKVEYRFTDKSAKGPLRTVKVIIEGWPATIFLTTDRHYIEELATRSFTVTPEASKEKIEQANRLTNLKAALPWEYFEETEEAKCIKALIESLKRQLVNGKTDVVIPFLNLHELFPKQIVRDMRDFQHFCQFLKATTVLHFLQRPFIKIGDKRFIISTVEDIKKALEIYAELFETTRTSTEQRILRFYHEIVKTKEGWYLDEITAKYNELHPEKKLSSDSIALMLKRLSEIGYVTIQKDSVDKRLNVYKPLIMEEEKGEIHRFLENHEFLSSELKKGFKEWLTKYPKNGHLFTYKNFSENTWGETEISIEELSKTVFKESLNEIPKSSFKENSSDNFSSVSKQAFFGYFSEGAPKLKNEKELENNRKTEIRGNSANSENPEGLIPCKLCETQGKSMFFATQRDLENHIQKCH